MKLTLIELDGQRCAEYVHKRFENMSYFSNQISNGFDFSDGKFYTIVPDQINPHYPSPDYYDFEVGGRIFPFIRTNESTQQHFNMGEEVVFKSSLEYVNANSSNCICLEDYNASPEAPYIKRLNHKYYLIDNRLIYLIDTNLSKEDYDNSVNSAVGYGFAGFILRIPSGLKGLDILPYSGINQVSKELIFASINSFYFEIYDEESYLIWVKKDDKSFFEILSNNVGLIDKF